MKNETPNADYSGIMDSKKDVVFSDIYDDAMNKLAASFGIPESLLSHLDRKRKFGLEKYGERAFQSTITNAVTSPAIAHLGDELIDAFNYTLHNYYIASMSVDADRMSLFKTVNHQLKIVARTMADIRSTLQENDPQYEALAWAEGFRNWDDLAGDF